MQWFLFAHVVASAAAVVTTQFVEIDGDFLSCTLSPAAGATITALGHVALPGDFASGDGLLQEGFGVESPYVPNRRLNESVEVVDDPSAPRGVRYSYDCDGPNIRGLWVTRVVDSVSGESSMRVRWSIENRGEETQWVAPWVRNDVAPGGGVDEGDRLDLPTVAGVRRIDRTAYYGAARNWAAATDPLEEVSIYGVFNADATYAFLALWDPKRALCGFQTAFLPFALKPGDTWTTTYRINVVRGLKHVEFADDALAAQIDFKPPRTLELALALSRSLPRVLMRAQVSDAEGHAWWLAEKAFTGKPDSVVRIRYDWEPPGDGVYALRAELTQDGARVALGGDTASPHGGIDTQFVVGSARDLDCAPWTEARHALERHGRVLRRPVVPMPGLDLWFESPLFKVFPEDRVEAISPAVSTARIALARHEHESLQVVLCPDRDIERLRVRVTPLTDRQGKNRLAAQSVSVTQVGYYPVVVPTNFEGLTGSWPDPLPARETFDLEGGKANPLWLTVYAPADAPAGIYKGLIELSAPALDPVELWLEVEVFDFALPKTPALKTDFGFSMDTAVEGCRARGFSGTEVDLAGRYFDCAAAHRVTLRALAQFPPESPHYQQDLDAFAERLAVLDESGATTFCVPVSLLDAPEQLRLANAFVRDHGLESRAFTQIAYEPRPPEWPRVYERMQQWEDTAPDIAVTATTLGLEPFLTPHLDIWSVHVQVFDTANNRTVLEGIRGGKEVWWYVNQYPPRPYGNLFVDFDAIEHRILFWQAWALGVRGFHYGSINACPDPWHDQLDLTPVNGNGCLVYPGESGPVASIRWETVRDGIEDYDYLVLLMARVRAARESGVSQALLDRAAEVANLSALLPNLLTFPREPSVLENKREEVARMIVELGKASSR
ncbi:MAG TPA: DUF4091 domain-containing protein [Candidatus Hydrogenedentes bacterium]|nr:DUF4091 domain-containing protein [Candidatus Hydrogenedentota bacterium]HPG68876.1 DUF4091 domain-containing protein [Candidatus Hydrogenedentota bacterium]